MMKRNGLIALAAAAAVSIAVPAAAGKAGEQLFKDNCAACHPKGGNVVNPAKTIGKAALTAAGIKTPGDIVKKMREPGPGMRAFDEKTISDKDAASIGKYILKTFK